MSHRIAVMSFVLVVLSATAMLLAGCGSSSHTSATSAALIAVNVAGSL